MSRAYTVVDSVGRLAAFCILWLCFYGPHRFTMELGDGGRRGSIGLQEMVSSLTPSFR